MEKCKFLPTNYPSDVTDEEWEKIKDLIPSGNRSEHHKRSLVNAVFYLVKTGCHWRQLPHDYPLYSTVWSFFRRARERGLWEKLTDVLVQMVREKAGRNSAPTYGIIDSQSVKTVAASEERGIDGGKKVKGRKHHIVVDVMGNLLAAVVHAANTHDTKSGIIPAKKAFDKYPTIEKFCGDAGYRKSFVEDVESQLGLEVDISERIAPVFLIIPKRWVVERTFAWMTNSRRLSKDYEITVESQEAIIYISHLRTLLRRVVHL